jgi:hypothetical protein
MYNFDLCLINCCWSSPAQSLLVPSPAGLMTIFYCLTTPTAPWLSLYSLGTDHSQQFYYCVRIRCRGNVFTQHFPRNGPCNHDTIHFNCYRPILCVPSALMFLDPDFVKFLTTLMEGTRSTLLPFD